MQADDDAAAVRDLHRLLESDLLAMFDEALDPPAPDALELLLLQDDDELELELSTFATFALPSALPLPPPSLSARPPPAPTKLRAIRPHTPVAPTVPAATTAAVAAPGRGRKRAKDEIEVLRREVAALEAQLSRLRLEKSEADAASDTESTSSESSGREGAERAIVAVKHAPTASTAYDLWRRVAAHQLEARQCAEAENARLRGLLTAQAKLAESVQRSFRKRPTTTDIHQPQQARKSLKCRRFLEDESIETRTIYANLATQLEPQFAQVDAVLADAGFVGRFEESCLGQVRTDPATGRAFVDLASSIVVPFDLESTSVAFWTLFNTSSDDLHAGVYKPVNRANTVLSAHYVATMPLRCGEAHTKGYIIAKQFTEEKRVVNVWSSAGTCESKVFGPGRVPIRERGWCVIEEVPEAARSGGSPTTIIRTMLHMHPEIDVAVSNQFVSENRIARTFADAVTDSFQDQLDLMHQATESIIMGIAVQ